MSDVLKRLGVAECSEPGELAADRAETRLKEVTDE